MVEGDDIEQIFFIKNGEFNVTIRKNLVQINTLIVYFGGTIHDKAEEEEEKMETDNIFKRFTLEKRVSNLSIQQQRDIIGLDDYIYEGKYAFTVENKLNRSEYWSIQKRVSLIF